MQTRGADGSGSSPVRSGGGIDELDPRRSNARGLKVARYPGDLGRLHTGPPDKAAAHHSCNGAWQFWPWCHVTRPALVRQPVGAEHSGRAGDT